MFCRKVLCTLPQSFNMSLACMSSTCTFCSCDLRFSARTHTKDRARVHGLLRLLLYAHGSSSFARVLAHLTQAVEHFNSAAPSLQVRSTIIHLPNSDQLMCQAHLKTVAARDAKKTMTVTRKATPAWAISNNRNLCLRWRRTRTTGRQTDELSCSLSSVATACAYTRVVYTSSAYHDTTCYWTKMFRY